MVDRLKKPSYWTIQILPEGSRRTRTFRFRKRTVKLFLAGGATLLFLASSLFIGVLGRRDAVEHLARYEAENEQLVGSLREMERRSGQLGRALDDLSAREQRFRLLAGLPLLDPDVYSVGVGGPGGGAPADDEFFEVAPVLAREAGDVEVDLEQLLRRADLLGASLAEASDSVGTMRDRFQRIPSIWPVIARDSWISSGFSHNRLHPRLGLRRPHHGIDISADFGSLVVATGTGRITFAGSRSGYGRLVIIEHGDGYESRYAHLGRISVRVGAEVRRGEVIGEVSDTGEATGPNLHYEVRRHDRPLNPVRYLLDDSYRR
ncbi:M23 family metallopeptidase [Candidatus Palauibacter sp.]|uniref:M23 family metallopeptidase n=1 Tax=Candidatus Palauibacter sp. TaxID=3101350 RepID=UPI003B012BAE